MHHVTITSYSTIHFLYISSLRAIASMGLKFFIYFTQKKKYFFYFTKLFLQNTHVSLSILNINSIKYLFFYILLLLFPSHSFLEPSHLLPLSLSHRSNTTQNHQQLATINNQSTPTITHLATIINPPFIKQPVSKNPNPKKC